jgi:hypothetical protein
MSSATHGLNSYLRDIIQAQKDRSIEEEVEFLETLPNQTFTQTEVDYLQPYFKTKIKAEPRPRDNSKKFYFFAKLFLAIYIIGAVLAALKEF